MTSLCVDVPNLALFNRTPKPVNTMSYAVCYVECIERFSCTAWPENHANATCLQSVPDQVFNIWQCINIILCIPNDNLFAILANLETMVILLPRRRWNSDNRAPVIKQWMVRFCIDIVCLPEIFFVAIYAYPAQCSGYITVNTRELVDFLQGWRWIVNFYATLLLCWLLPSASLTEACLFSSSILADSLRCSSIYASKSDSSNFQDLPILTG